MTEEFDIKMGRGRTLHCPKCGKKAQTFMRPQAHRMADYRLECECTSLSCLVIYQDLG